MPTASDAWKLFLQGRIAQEQGNIDQAVGLFDRALQQDPDNPAFLKAKSNALLQKSGGPGGDGVGTISAKYNELAKKYVGENDKPALWIEAIQNLLNQVDAGTFGGASLGVAMVW